MRSQRKVSRDESPYKLGESSTRQVKRYESQYESYEKKKRKDIVQHVMGSCHEPLSRWMLPRVYPRSSTSKSIPSSSKLASHSPDVHSSLYLRWCARFGV